MQKRIRNISFNGTDVQFQNCWVTMLLDPTTNAITGYNLNFDKILMPNGTDITVKNTIHIDFEDDNETFDGFSGSTGIVNAPKYYQDTNVRYYEDVWIDITTS